MNGPSKRAAAIAHGRELDRQRNGPRPGLLENLVKLVYDSKTGGWLGIGGLAVGVVMGIMGGRKVKHMLDNYGRKERPQFPGRSPGLDGPAQEPERQPEISLNLTREHFPDISPGETVADGQSGQLPAPARTAMNPPPRNTDAPSIIRT